MFQYLHEAAQHKARARKQKSGPPPVRPKPPVPKPPTSQAKAPVEVGAAAANTSQSQQPTLKPADGTSPQISGATPPTTALPSAAVENATPVVAAAPSTTPMVPTRTRTKPHKRIALKPAASAPTARTLPSATKTAPTSDAPLTRTLAVDPDPRAVPISRSSPALKRKGQHTDFSNPSVSLSVEDTGPDNGDINDDDRLTLDTIPSLHVSADLLSIASTTSLGSLRETPEPAVGERAEDVARPQSPVAR